MAPLWNEERHAVIFSGEPISSSTVSSNGPLLTSSSGTEEESFPLRIKADGRRSVSFSPDAAVLVDAVICIDDYSPAERRGCWFQSDEMKAIRAELKDTVALMNKNLPMETMSRASADLSDPGTDVKTYTIHGLEGKTKVGKRRRKEMRLASLAAVFDEQSLQEMDGICDPVMIARAYAEYSYPMQVAAFQRAALYEKEAAEIYRAMKEENDNQPSPHQGSASTDTRCSFSTETTVGPMKVLSYERPSTFKDEEKKEEKSEDALESISSSVSSDFCAVSELEAIRRATFLMKILM